MGDTGFDIEGWLKNSEGPGPCPAGAKGEPGVDGRTKPHYKYLGNDTYWVTIPVNSMDGKPMKPIELMSHKSQILEGIKIDDQLRREMARFLFKDMPEVNLKL